jgi:hypothetical protein
VSYPSEAAGFRLSGHPAQSESQTRRVSHHFPCPVCKRPDWCRVAYRDGQPAYTICNRIESDTPARGAGGGWIHREPGRPGSGWQPRVIAEPAKTPTPAGPQRLDSVYRKLLNLCPLAARHRQDLHSRGFTAEQVDALGCGSLGLRGRARLCRTLIDSGARLEGVPGFYLARGVRRLYWTIAGLPGLLIPCRGGRGGIRGLRVRPDETPDAPADVKAGGKYRWFSGADRLGGVGSGAHCHVARPGSDIRAEEPEWLWLTEGELKAALAAFRLGITVLSIPGVGSWAKALPDVVELLPAGGRVVVALDSDWRSKPDVHRAAWNLALACEAIGYLVEVATWPERFKGLDDALMGDARLERRPPRQAIPEPPWPYRLGSASLATDPRKAAAPMTLSEGRAKLNEEMRIPYQFI